MLEIHEVADHGDVQRLHDHDDALALRHSDGVLLLRLRQNHRRHSAPEPRRRPRRGVGVGQLQYPADERWRHHRARTETSLEPDERRSHDGHHCPLLLRLLPALQSASSRPRNFTLPALQRLRHFTSCQSQSHLEVVVVTLPLCCLLFGVERMTRNIGLADYDISPTFNFRVRLKALSLTVSALYGFSSTSW